MKNHIIHYHPSCRNFSSKRNLLFSLPIEPNLISLSSTRPTPTTHKSGRTWKEKADAISGPQHYPFFFKKKIPHPVVIN